MHMKTGFSLLSLALVSLYSNDSSAASMTLFGELVSKFPTVSSTPAADMTMGVRNSSLAVKSDNSGCVVAFDVNTFTAGQINRCLIEFTNIPTGWALDKTTGKFSGISKVKGNQTIGYSVSYLSGTAATKVKISSGNIVVAFLDPVSPVISNLTSTTDDRAAVIGPKNTSYDKTSNLTVKVSVEPRNYVQLVSVAGAGSCNVAEQGADCTITTITDKLFTDIVKGSKPMLVTANSSNQYFTNTASEFTFDWDFTSPTTNAFDYNSLANTSDKTIAGKVVSFNHALASISSPHVGLAGTWWNPASVVMDYAPDSAGLTREASLSYDDHVLIYISQASASGDDQLTGKRVGTGVAPFVYDFDLSKLRDGDYTASITAKDAYDNASTSTIKKFSLRRNLPEIKIFNGKNYNSVGSGTPIFFSNTLTIAAWNGFKGEVTNVKATLNGKDLPLAASDTDGVFLVGDYDLTGLITGETYPLTVTATDKIGNQSTLTTNIIYAPIKFGMTTYVPTQQVEEVSWPLAGKGLTSCKLYSNESEASSYASLNAAMGCYIEWVDVPTGLSPSVSDKGQYSLSGYMENLTGTVAYRIYMYDQYGNHSIVDKASFTVTALPMLKPEISISSRKMADSGEYISDLKGGLLGSAKMVTSQAASVGSVMINGAVVKSAAFKMRKKKNATTQENQLPVEIPAGNQVWKSIPITITSAYKRKPTEVTSKVVNVYYIPDSRTKIEIKNFDRAIADTTTSKVTVAVGLKQKDGTMSYNLNLAEWNVHLEQVTNTTGSDGKRVKTTKVVSNTVKTKADGTAELTLNNKDLLAGSSDFTAVAEAITPLPNFSLKIRSAKVKTVLYKGTAIEGGLKRSQIITRTPVAISIGIQFDTKQDRDAAGLIQWEVASNGGAYVVDPTFQNKETFRLRSNDAGNWKIRAKFTNRVTNVVSYTDPLNVVGYEKPEPAIVQKELVMQGNPVTISVVDGNTNEPIDDPIDVMWSLDGVNYEEGGTSFTFDPESNDSGRVYAKIRFSDEADAGDVAWVTKRFVPSVVKPRTLAASLTAPRTVEVNTPFTLKAKVTNPITTVKGLTVISEWEKPDGTIVSGDSLTTMADSDIPEKLTYKFRSWLDGYKDATLVEKVTTVGVWQYVFPKLLTGMQQTYSLAPTTITVKSATKLTAFDGVTYDLTMTPSAGIEVVKNADGVFVGNVSTGGMYSVTVTLKDNRGNIATNVHTFNIENADPMVVKLKPDYSSSFMREPLDVGINSVIGMDNYRDRVESLSWTVDGEPQLNVGRILSLSGLGVGKHSVALTVTSQFGQRGDTALDFEVVPNKPPVCTPTVSSGSISWTVSMNCKDPDGRMLAYRWIIGNEAKGVTSGNIALTKSLYQAPLVVTGVGVDDSGAETSQDIVLK